MILYDSQHNVISEIYIYSKHVEIITEEGDTIRTADKKSYERFIGYILSGINYGGIVVLEDEDENN